MLVSVVTVCRNSAAVIGGALESLRRQTWTEREWVVIDGNSTDETMQIVRSSGERLGYCFSEPDSGIYNAMNKGIARSKGDVLFFLNSDDALMDGGVLADIAGVFAANPELEMVFGDVVYDYGRTRILRTFAHIDTQTLMFEDLCHQAVFARRSLFDKVGTFNERFRLNADYDWLIRVMRSGARWRYLQRRVATFRVGGAHSADPAKLKFERRAVRLQYLSSSELAVGLLWRRFVHRWHRHFGPHPMGQVPIGD